MLSHSFTQFFSLSLVLGPLLTSVSAAVAKPDLVARQTASTCASQLHLIIAGGCALPCASDEPGLLSTLISNITTAFPGSDEYYVPYNGSAAQAKVSTPLMIAAANEYLVSCPNTPVVFIGYSLGGIVIMNTLCGGISYSPNVIAAITYGEETQTYPQVYDVGTCTNSAPLYPRANAASCSPFSSSLFSVCLATDSECCTGGTDGFSHFDYPNLYDVKATKFVISRYAAFASSKSSSTSSIAPSTSTTTSSVKSSSFANSTTASSTSTLTSTASSTTIAVLPSSSSSSVASSTPIATSPSSSSTSTTSVSSVNTAASTTSIATSISLSTASVSATVVSTTTTTSTASVSTASSTTSMITTSVSATSTPTFSSSSSTPSPSVSTSSVSTKTTSTVSSGGIIVVPTVSNANSTGTTTTTTAKPSIISSVLPVSVRPTTVASLMTGTIANVTSTVTSPKPTYSVVYFTGGASTLSMPGFTYMQWTFRTWRSLAAIMAA